MRYAERLIMNLGRINDDSPTRANRARRLHRGRHRRQLLRDFTVSRMGRARQAGDASRDAPPRAAIEGRHRDPGGGKDHREAAMTEQPETDAEVIAALDAYSGEKIGIDWSIPAQEHMRAALDAAAQWRRAQPASGLAESLAGKIDLLERWLDAACKTYAEERIRAEDAEAQLAARDADVARLRDVLIGIGEYWNGNQTEAAMIDALETIDERVSAALAPLPEKTPTDEKQS